MNESYRVWFSRLTIIPPLIAVEWCFILPFTWLMAGKWDSRVYEAKEVTTMLWSCSE